MKSFFIDNTQACIKLNFVKEGEFAPAHLSSKQQNFLNSQNFVASSKQIAYIFTPSGCISEVFIGYKYLHEALAFAALELPEGKYYPANTLAFKDKLYWGLAQYEAPKINILAVEKSAIFDLESLIDAYKLARDLINQPANILHPDALAYQVQLLAKKYNAQYENIKGQELVENYPAIATVGQAAAIPAQLAILKWGDKSLPLVSLVGKGVCFDSGGLNIKAGNGMRLMKKDMGGAAHALGLAQWIMAQKLALRLEVYIPAVENAIAGNAYRPGDIITMRNKLKVEIDNTDAEGRLILADTITKACEQQPELLIDFATLTGAARVAVGPDIATMFSNDQKLANEIISCAAKTEDPVWQLPLFAGYEPWLDSKCADIVNSCSTPYAGAITAALFLKKFVQPNIPWLHFDIMAWNIESRPGHPFGGEALSFQALCEYFKQRFAN